MKDKMKHRQASNGEIFYYHPNHLASTMYVTNAQQSVVQSFLYAPYGEIISEYNTHAMGEAFPKYSFNAKELDEETGMYYYEARYYAPPTFTSRDLLFEKYFWMSPYAYCANNPVKYVDPTGRIIDPSKLTAAQQEKYNNTISLACERSSLFNTMYEALNKSKTIYKIKIGKTKDNVPAQYNKSDNSITFQNEEKLAQASAYIEEMFHAYQMSENKNLYIEGVSFNYEFEAKLAKHFMMLELNLPISSGAFQNMPILDKISEYTNNGEIMPSATLLNNSILQELYKKEANKYSDLNKTTNYGDDNYKVPTRQKPASLLKLFEDAGY